MTSQRFSPFVSIDSSVYEAAASLRWSCVPEVECQRQQKRRFSIILFLRPGDPTPLPNRPLAAA